MEQEGVPVKGKVLELKTGDSSSFVRVWGPENGQGPYNWQYDKVSLQLVVVLEALTVHLKDELFQMVQGVGSEEEKKGS